jgi:hypothetical protein
VACSWAEAGASVAAAWLWAASAATAGGLTKSSAAMLVAKASVVVFIVVSLVEKEVLADIWHLVHIIMPKHFNLV